MIMHGAARFVGRLPKTTQTCKLFGTSQPYILRTNRANIGNVFRPRFILNSGGNLPAKYGILIVATPSFVALAIVAFLTIGFATSERTQQRSYITRALS
jgi:hypothetical protein